MLAAIVSSGCSSLGRSAPAWKAAVAGDGPGDPALLDASANLEVRNLPKSRRGNPSVYRVFGRPYRVLNTASGFVEQGVASWYGAKFHGRDTSSGEVYDMHQLTAAHKHLPLPTFVRVTRVDNGDSIIVKVNDRGPFVGNRIIDLSYAAAAQLDMLDTGTARVSIEALSTHEADRASAGAQQTETKRYIQLGAFREDGNAAAFKAHVQQYVSLPVAIDHDLERDLHRVRLGPLQDARMLQQALDSLASAGIASYTMVSVSQ
jgi:rare lipoprotein A